MNKGRYSALLEIVHEYDQSEMFRPVTPRIDLKWRTGRNALHLARHANYALQTNNGQP